MFSLSSKISKTNSHSNPTILVVESDRTQLILMERLLRSRNYSVLSVQRAEDALRMLNKVHVDLIVCDLHMPQMSGRHFVRKLRTRRDCADIPVISTSEMEEFDLEELLSHGFNSFCSRRNAPIMLCRQIEELLAGKPPVRSVG